VQGRSWMGYEADSKGRQWGATAGGPTAQPAFPATSPSRDCDTFGASEAADRTVAADSTIAPTGNFPHSAPEAKQAADTGQTGQPPHDRGTVDAHYPGDRRGLHTDLLRRRQGVWRYWSGLHGCGPRRGKPGTMFVHPAGCQPVARRIRSAPGGRFLHRSAKGTGYPHLQQCIDRGVLAALPRIQRPCQRKLPVAPDAKITQPRCSGRLRRCPLTLRVAF